jgi:hypothetical protein
MSRSMLPVLKRFRGPAILLALLAMALLLPSLASACGEEGGEDTAPIVSDAHVSPAGLPSDGGPVAIYATVEDDCGVAMVYTEMYGANGFVQSVQMLPWEVAPNGVVTYRSETSIAPNFQEEALSYQFDVQATDTNGAAAEAYAGEVEVTGAPQFDEAPYVYEWSVTPSLLSAAGGPVTIKTFASDNRSVSYVYALVTPSDGGPGTEVPLEPIGPNQFEGVFHMPANADGIGKSYAVEVVAQDDIGQETSADAGTILIAGAKPGKLNAWTSNGSYFGVVNVGTHATRQVVVRNAGAKGTAPVSAVFGAAGAPFYVPGRPAGIPFTLAAGQKRTFNIEFRPSTPGFRTGGAIIEFPTESQPKFAVKLTGQGYKPPPPPH